MFFLVVTASDFISTINGSLSYWAIHRGRTPIGLWFCFDAEGLTAVRTDGDGGVREIRFSRLPREFTANLSHRLGAESLLFWVCAERDLQIFHIPKLKLCLFICF